MSYNKFSAIKIGGSNVNTIPSTFNGTTLNTSLEVTGQVMNYGNTYSQGTLYLGNETSVYDSETLITTYTDTGGNIVVKLLGVTYTITPQILSYLSTLSSNVQTQINSITGGSGAYVTLSGSQTITGLKTFNSGLYSKSDVIIYKNSDNTKYWYINSNANTLIGYWNGSGSSIAFNGDTGTGAFSGSLSANGGLTSTTYTASGLIAANGGLTSTTYTASGLIAANGGLTSTTYTASGLITANAGITLGGGTLSAFSTTVGSSCFFNASSGYPNTTRTHILNELRVVNNTIPSGGFTGNLSASIGNGFLMGWNAGGSGAVAHFINSTDLGGTSGFRFYNYTNAGVYQSTSLILNSNGTANTPNLLTCDGGLTIPTTKVLTLVGNISANSATITPVELSYLDGVTSNLQTQINSITGGSGSYATLSGTQSFTGNNTFTGDVVFSKVAGAININNGATMTFSGGSALTISASGFLNVNGVSLDSTTLSYIQTLTSDAQTQLNNKAGISTNNTFTGVNYFNNNDVYMAHPTNVATFRLRSSRPATQIELFPETNSRISLGSSSGYPMIQLNETQFINGSVNNASTITLPLYKHYIYRTTTTNFTITLPAVTSSHQGYSIKLFKTASTALSQVLTINADATNRILEANSMTELTSSAVILGAGITSCELAICVLQSGTIGWIERSDLRLNAPNIWSANNTFSSGLTSSGAIVSSGIIMSGTGNVLTFATPITDSVTATELYNLKSSSSNIQTQLNNRPQLASSNTFTNTNQFNSGIITQTIEPVTVGSSLNIGLTSTQNIKFGSDSVANAFRFNNTLDFLTTTNITTNTTLAFPLSSTYIIRSATGSLTITLPAVTSFHVGKQINIVRTGGSLTNVITITPNASNRIVEAGTITELTSSVNILASGNTSTTLVIGILDSGLFGWIEVGESAKKNVANTYTGVQTFSSSPVSNGTASSNTNLITLQDMRTYFGVYLYVSIATGNVINHRLIKSVTNLASNLFNQAATSGSVTTQQSGTAVGLFHAGPAINLLDAYYLVGPNSGIIGYGTAGYTGTIYINYKNTTSSPVFVRPSTANLIVSIRVYYNDVEQT